MNVGEFMGSIKCPKCKKRVGVWFSPEVSENSVLFSHSSEGQTLCLELSKRTNFDLVPYLAEHIESVLKAAQEKLNGSG